MTLATTGTPAPTQPETPPAADDPRAWWRKTTFIGFDTETTGPDPHTDRIVTANLCMVQGGELLSSRDWLIDPGVEIPAEAAAVHGVSTERARAEGMPAGEGVAAIVATLADLTAAGAPVVAFNAAFDFTVLDREARRHGIAPFVPTAVVDPFVLDKQLDRYRKGRRTLGVMCEHYGVRLTDAHSADADALAAVQLTVAIAERELESTGAAMPPPADLHLRQVAWRAEQCASLEEYLRKKDPTAGVEREWPVLPRRFDAHAVSRDWTERDPLVLADAFTAVLELVRTAPRASAVDLWDVAADKLGVQA